MQRLLDDEHNVYVRVRVTSHPLLDYYHSSARPCYLVVICTESARFIHIFHIFHTIRSVYVNPVAVL